MHTKLILAEGAITDGAEGEFDWPEDEKLFYVLGTNGLFIGRNNTFYRTLVKADKDKGPSELEEVEESCYISFPKIPKALFEQVAGFFHQVAKDKDAEAQCLFYYDPNEKKVHAVIPKQKSGLKTYSLKYEQPTTVPDHWVLFGDAHSHVDHEAYCSGTDIADENKFPGVHIVFGKMISGDGPKLTGKAGKKARRAAKLKFGKKHKPTPISVKPQIHAVVVVDKTRFEPELEDIIGGFSSYRYDFPETWIDNIEFTSFSQYYQGKKYAGGSGYGYSTMGGHTTPGYQGGTTSRGGESKPFVSGSDDVDDDNELGAWLQGSRSNYENKYGKGNPSKYFRKTTDKAGGSKASDQFNQEYEDSLIDAADLSSRAGDDVAEFNERDLADFWWEDNDKNC